MITTLIFDADGVLVNGEKFSLVMARNFDIDQVKVQEFFTDTFPDCLVGKADLKESIEPYLPGFGWSGTADDLLEYWFKAEHNINAELVGYIHSLRDAGLKVVMATNQEKYRTRYMIDRMGFSDVFDKIYSSAHLGHKKPAIEFFEKVVNDIGSDKQETLFWDDDIQNIEGAISYGIHAEFYQDFEEFVETMQSSYGLPAARA